MDNTHAIMQQHRCDELMMLAIFFFFCYGDWVYLPLDCEEYKCTLMLCNLFILFCLFNCGV